MFDKRIPQKNRTLAAFLAFLVPGLGHYYQGRIFKASVYACCILGTYTYGMAMSDGNGVYTHQISNMRSVRNFSFLAQAGVGTMGVVAVGQSQRYFNQTIDGSNIYPVETGLDTDITGIVKYQDGTEEVIHKVQGHLNFAPTTRTAERIVGKLTSTIDGQQIELQLAHPSCNEPVLSAKGTWTLDCVIVEEQNGQLQQVGLFEGEIPRPFFDRFCMPPDTQITDGWYNTYGGKTFDLAVAMTMIAGLLNFLAVWDCLEGPAHGYGDELEEESSEKEPSTAE